jgi:nifR3 family TIM-barrel protein
VTKKPLLALAPMDGVTDFAFRSVVKKYGKVDLLWTEFVSVEALCRGAAPNLISQFDYNQTQQPIIAQIFGKTPEYFYLVALLVAELGFAGVDINMGCPAKTVAQSGSGAALIAQPKLAQEIIRKTQLAIKDWANGKKLSDCVDVNLKLLKALEKQKTFWGIKKTERKAIPVSVKTRLGISNNQLDHWLPNLLETELDLISLHGRTLKQGYSGQADWQALAKAGEMIKSTKSKTQYFANGDVKNYEEALQKAKLSQADGIMIGRASCGNPFVFLPITKRQQLSTKDFFNLAIEHAELFEKHNLARGKDKFFSMRKHLAWYIKAVPDAAQLRAQLVRSNSAQEVKIILKDYQTQHEKTWIEKFISV